MAATFNTIATDAFFLIGAYGPGDELTPADMTFALRSANAMINRWTTLPLTWPVVDRESFTITANVSTYTIGPGGDLDTTRPLYLTGAALLLNASSPPVEIPTALLTDDAYEALQIKTLTNIQWTNVYYNPTYSDELGTIFLWPTPTTATNSLILYRGHQFEGFTMLTASHDLPPGYQDAITYQLALRLAVVYGRTIPDDLRQQAMSYLGDIKRANAKIADLRVDGAITANVRGGYNINTGNY